MNLTKKKKKKPNNRNNSKIAGCATRDCSAFILSALRMCSRFGQTIRNKKYSYVVCLLFFFSFFFFFFNVGVMSVINSVVV